MLVKDVMVTEVKTIDQEATVQEAAKEMVKWRVGSLVVVKGTRLVGIVTEDDIMMKIVAENKDPSKVRVKEIMTKEVIMIGPNEDLDYALEIMKSKKIKKLPVVSGDRLIGIITTTDICMAEPMAIKQLSELLLMPQDKKIIAG
jgi:CBS domain-containing protein